VGKPKGKRPLGRPRSRWVDNIKMDIRDIGWDGVEWINMAQDRDQWKALVNTVLPYSPPTVSYYVTRRPVQPRTMDLREHLFSTIAFITVQ
jgi:hypothetical protein